MQVLNQNVSSINTCMDWLRDIVLRQSVFGNGYISAHTLVQNKNLNWHGLESGMISLRYDVLD